MGGKITEDIMPNEIKKPLDKFANKFGDMFVPKELAKPLMMAAPYLGPIAGPIAAAAGSAKEHGGIDYDLVAMTYAMNMEGPQAGPANQSNLPHSKIPTNSAAYTQPLQSSVNNPWYTPSGMHQGITNARDFLVGNPADRNLGLGFQNPFAAGGQSPITMDPGSSWTNMFSGNTGIFGQNPDWDLIKAGATDIGAAGTAQFGMMTQKEVIEDYKKQQEREEARNRGFWQNYFAGMTRNRPYETGRMGDEIDQLYAQYGAADEYDPYYGMREAYSGTYFDDDRWYGKKGGRIGLYGGGNPHLDVNPIRPRSAGLETLLQKLGKVKRRISDEERARIRERARIPGGRGILEGKITERFLPKPMRSRIPNQRVGLALGGNDEVGGLSSLTSQIPKNVPGVPNGMQIDARKPGGTYIDAGTKPKADDVPAMLSEGEFVITKDGMEGFDLQTGGPGDSRSGAKKMYAQMNEWETVAAQAGV